MDKGFNQPVSYDPAHDPGFYKPITTKPVDPGFYYRRGV